MSTRIEEPLALRRAVNAHFLRFSQLRALFHAFLPLFALCTPMMLGIQWLRTLKGESVSLLQWWIAPFFIPVTLGLVLGLAVLVQRFQTRSATIREDRLKLSPGFSFQLRHVTRATLSPVGADPDFACLTIRCKPPTNIGETVWCMLVERNEATEAFVTQLDANSHAHSLEDAQRHNKPPAKPLSTAHALLFSLIFNFGLLGPVLWMHYAPDSSLTKYLRSSSTHIWWFFGSSFIASQAVCCWLLFRRPGRPTGDDDAVKLRQKPAHPALRMR